MEILEGDEDEICFGCIRKLLEFNDVWDRSWIYLGMNMRLLGNFKLYLTVGIVCVLRGNDWPQAIKSPRHLIIDRTFNEHYGL